MPTRFCLIAAGCLTLCCFVAPLARAQKPAETPEQRTERVLDEEATLEFVETPLQKVLKYLEDTHAVKIELTPETMRGEHRLDPKMRVTLNLKQLSLRSGLHLLLDRYNAEVTIKPDGTLLLVPSTKELRAKRVESKVQQRAHAKLQVKLLTELGNAEFINTPLKDVIQFLSDQAGCTIAFDRRAIEEAGISPDEPITCHALREQPLNRLLQFVLLPFDLRAIIQDEVLLIVNRDKEAKTEPSGAVAAALEKKLDIDLAQPLPTIAAHLSEKTGIPFLLHSPALTKASIDMERALVIKEKGVTPAEAITRTKPALPLKLIERDGMVLISVEAKR